MNSCLNFQLFDRKLQAQAIVNVSNYIPPYYLCELIEDRKLFKLYERKNAKIYFVGNSLHLY